jgi:myosin-1
MAEEVTHTSGSAHGGQMRHLLEEMVGLGDMVLLEPVTEKAFVENLRVRHAAKEIYVSLGCMIDF